MFQSHSGTALRRTLLLVVMAPHAHHLHAPHHQQCDCQKGELTTGLTTVAVAKYENARKIQRHSCKENVFALHLSQCYSAFISHAVQALIIKKVINMLVMARMRFRPPPSHVAQPLSKCRFKRKARHLTRAQNLGNPEIAILPPFFAIERQTLTTERQSIAMVTLDVKISTTYKMAMLSALKKHPHGSTQSSRKNHSFILADD